MRTYDFITSRPGGFMNYPGQCVTTNLRIRTVTLYLFRRWFGRGATEHWHVDGFMAQAWDNRGNHIEVTQINHATGRDIALVRTGICDACGQRRAWDDLRAVNCAPVVGASICCFCKFPLLLKEVA